MEVHLMDDRAIEIISFWVFPSMSASFFERNNFNLRNRSLETFIFLQTQPTGKV